MAASLYQCHSRAHPADWHLGGCMLHWSSSWEVASVMVGATLREVVAFCQVKPLLPGQSYIRYYNCSHTVLQKLIKLGCVFNCNRAAVEINSHIGQCRQNFKRVAWHEKPKKLMISRKPSPNSKKNILNILLSSKVIAGKENTASEV